MPAKSQRHGHYCPWCQATYAPDAVGAHVTSPHHRAGVLKVEREAKYRPRQGDLPFPPTLHDPPKLR